MIYPYQLTSGHRYEPIIPIHLQAKTGWILFNSFVDTGANFSVFHADVAQILGLSLTKGKKSHVIVGDGDRMIIYLHKVTVKFSNHVFRASIAFSSALGSGFNLIGRKDFFETFQFCFNDRTKTVSVKKL